MSPFTPNDAGPILGAHLGIYQGEQIISLALDAGWETEVYKKEDYRADSEFHHEAVEAAENHLNEIAPEGYYFGTTEGLDWGLWKREGS